MRGEINTIRLSLPLGMGSVNCYLLPAASGYVLIDTGPSMCRKPLIRALESAGCQPGLLQLIVLTHGDFDHTGNARYLRQAFGSKIAMHAGDAPMAERGDMFVNRKPPNAIIRKIVPLFSGFGRAQRFSPDLLVEDGDDLSAYGLDARVISIPGHSRGSIGVLTAAGDLFCGDLLENRDRPVLNSLMDDPAAAAASMQRLESLGVGAAYPGHGGPFPFHLVGAGGSWGGAG